MRLFAVFLCLFACLGAVPRPARAADPLVDNAVNALAQLTDPRRLSGLPEGEFRAQLGPALGWLNVARHEDVSPECVIVRALARNGLDGERARLTRDALLRNLARADAWELFNHAESTRALALGAPAPIPAGIHQGHLAQAAVVLPDGLTSRDRREFACLVLRADDEGPPPSPRGSHRRQPGDLLARGRGGIDPSPGGHGASGVQSAARRGDAPPDRARRRAVADGGHGGGDEDALPVAYATRGQDDGKIAVREELAVGQPLALAALGGPARRFVLRGVDGGTVRFELLDGPSPRAFALPLAQERPANGATRAWTIYDEPGAMRIVLYDPAPGADGGTRTVLFEFAPGARGPIKSLKTSDSFELAP